MSVGVILPHNGCYYVTHSLDSRLMNTFPLFFKLENQPVVIIGGGEVALRKADLLSRAQANITIVAPSICDELTELLSADRHQFIYGSYHADHLTGAR